MNISDHIGLEMGTRTRPVNFRDHDNERTESE